MVLLLLLLFFPLVCEFQVIAILFEVFFCFIRNGMLMVNKIGSLYLLVMATQLSVNARKNVCFFCHIFRRFLSNFDVAIAVFICE